MESNCLECPICYQNYNLTNRIPMVLPICGHTVCYECIEKLFNAQRLACPLDKKSFSHLSIQSFPKNFAFMSLLEETLQKEVCDLHQHEEVKVICLTDKLKICAICALMKHKEHEWTLISEHKVEKDRKTEDIETQIRNTDAFFQEIVKDFTNKKANLAREVDSSFQLVSNILEKKKKNMMERLESWFSQENSKLNLVIEVWKQMRDQIRSSAKALKNDLFSGIQEFENLYQNLVTPKELLNKEAYLNDLNLYINQELDTLKEFVNFQEVTSDVLDKFICPLENFSKKLDKESRPLCLNRFKSFCDSCNWRGGNDKLDGISFYASKDIWIIGFGMYPDGLGTINGEGKLIRGDSADGEVIWKSQIDLRKNFEEDNKEPLKIFLDKPYKIKAEECISITFAFSSYKASYSGDDGQCKVNADGDVIFTFQECQATNNGTSIEIGLVPEIYYHI